MHGERRRWWSLRRRKWGRGLFANDGGPHRVGLLHPFIHLGYGLEFELPAVIAEALAQASVEPVRDNSTAALLLAAENAAADPKVVVPVVFFPVCCMHVDCVIQQDTHKTLATLLEEIHNDPKIRSATTWETIAIELSGLIENAGKEIISYVSQFSVPTDQLELKMAESINASGAPTSPTFPVCTKNTHIHL